MQVRAVLRRGLKLCGIRSIPGKVPADLEGEYVQSKLLRGKLKDIRMFSTISDMPPSFGPIPNGNRQLSVGLVGAGRVGSTVHLPHILKNHKLRLSWVVENSRQAVEAVQEDLYLDVPFYTSDHLERLLDDPSLDAVFVCTPTPLHYEIIFSSLQKGKAVFTEKPTGETLEQTMTLYDLAKKMNRPLLTGYNRRFDPSFRDAYDMVVSGQIGQLLISKMVMRDSPKPSEEQLSVVDRSDASIFSDLAVHDIDFMTWLKQGAAPEMIYATASKYHTSATEPDICAVTMKYSDGTIALLDGTRETSYGYDSRIELFGSHGNATAGNPRESLATKDYEEGTLLKRNAYSFPQRFVEAFKNQQNHFIDCVEGKAVPLVTKEECIVTGLVAQAAVESYKQNQAINCQDFFSSIGFPISR